VGNKKNAALTEVVLSTPFIEQGLQKKGQQPVHYSLFILPVNNFFTH
jgi:hypothetical protein